MRNKRFTKENKMTLSKNQQTLAERVEQRAAERTAEREDKIQSLQKLLKLAEERAEKAEDKQHLAAAQLNAVCSDLSCFIISVQHAINNQITFSLSDIKACIRRIIADAHK
jgi:hypothetical protein